MRTRLILLITALVLFVFTANAQVLKLQSKDSLNGKPKKEFYTTAWIKLSGFYDVQGIPNRSSMNIPSIPTEIEGVPADPQFFMDAFQSRLIFSSTFQSEKLGEIHSYIETDFYGNGGGGMRLRHAYIKFDRFRFGQTWSIFTDEDAWANITDFDGPATGAWVRNTQLAYYPVQTNDTEVIVSIETPQLNINRYLPLDSTLTGANQKLPDFLGHYKRSWSTGHVQIGAVLRAIDYKNTTTGENKYIPGYGLNLSGTFKMGDRDKVVYQVAGGEGIARYLVSFGGGGWDAFPDFKGSLEAVPIYGGYVGFQHYWDKKPFDDPEESHWSSTFVYGHARVENPINTPAQNLLIGTWISGNLYWHITDKTNFAIEGIYGRHVDEVESVGDNLRVQFVMEYVF